MHDRSFLYEAMIYTFSIGGFRIRCDVPHALSCTECTLPFLVDNDDYDILFQCIGKPSISLDCSGTWVEDACYTPDAVYFSPMRGMDPYAKVYPADAFRRHYICEYIFGREDLLASTLQMIQLLSLEKLFLGVDGFILHSSFISYRGKGILFSAPSGTGKSTQASLWEKYEGAEILNGDRGLLVRRGEDWTVSGMPFAGSSGIYRNETVSLGAIVILRQSPENSIRPVAPGEAIRYLYPEISMHRWSPDFVNSILSLVLDLLSKVPVFLLDCRPDQGAVHVLKNVLD